MNTYARKIIVALMCIFILSLTTIASASPFSDVPQGHWAYDAVSQLASNGVLDLSGHKFDGTKTVTRFEFASLLSKTAEKTISEQQLTEKDKELLQRLYAEFHTELQAIGMKIENIDRRLAKMENNIGGWNISGVYFMDLQFTGGEGRYFSQFGQRYDINHNRLRLYLDKRINETSSFHAEARWGAEGANYNQDFGYGDLRSPTWVEFYADTMLPGDISLRAGRFTTDYEDEYGFYADFDSTFADYRLDGFRAGKDFGKFRAEATLGRNAYFEGYDWDQADYTHFHTIFNLKYEPNERFFAGGSLYWYKAGEMSESAVSEYGDDWDVTTWWLYGKYTLFDNVDLKAKFYKQELGSSLTSGFNANPMAYNIILDIGQDALKFSSLWIEFSRQDNNFCAPEHDYYTIFGGCSDRYSLGGADTGYDWAGANLTANNGTSSFFFVRAEQEWTDKFSTFERFVYADLDTPGYSNGRELCAGVIYKLNEAVAFQLLYSNVDHGENYNPDPEIELRNGSNHVVQFRTKVSF